MERWFDYFYKSMYRIIHAFNEEKKIMTIEKVHEQRIKERRKMEHNINDTDDIVEKMRLLVADGTIWLTQKEIAELFQTTKQSIGMHIRFILKHGELDERVVVSYRLADRKQGTMQGKLQVRKTAHYNSDMVLAVARRVCSPRGRQFRRYDTAVLKEYLGRRFCQG